MVPAAGNQTDFTQRIDQAVGVLFALVTESLGWATNALLEQDVDGANRVIADDRRIDEQCEDISELVKERLSTIPLDPDELESLIAILQIVPELERSADLAKHIAQRSLRGLGGIITPKSRGLIQSMSDVAVRMWRLAGAAYSTRSRDAIFELYEADSDLDELAAALVTEGVAQGTDARVAVDLALIARFYERLGDHAVNLARRVETMAAPKRRPSSAIWDRVRRKRAREASAGFLNVPAGKAPKAKRSESSRQRSSGGLFGRAKRLRMAESDESFFELFDEAANNARDCAAELRKLASSFTNIDEHFAQIKDYERRGDQITVELLRLLDNTYATPYDREDIHSLVEELDDVVDDMFAAASIVHLVPVQRPLPEIAHLTEILYEMSDETVGLMDALRTRERARQRLERIEHLERQGDAVFRSAIARLFSGEYEPIEVLKWKDITQSIEDSLNAIEDVSDVVESIMVKRS